MEFKEYFKLILIVGSVISFLMSAFLAFFPGYSFANRVLSVLIFAWALTTMIFALSSVEFFMRFPHLFGVASIFPILFFPLMFAYLKSFLYRDARSLKQYLIHFIPAAAFIVAMLPFYFSGAEDKIAIFTSGGRPDWYNMVHRIFDMIVVFQGVIYTVLSMRILMHFEYFRKKKLSVNQLKAISWLKLFVTFNIIFWGIGSSGAILGVFNFAVPIDLFKVFYLGVTAFTLRLGYFAFKNPKLFAMQQDLADLLLQQPKTTEGNEIEEEKPIREAEMLLEYLNDEKPFLKNDLSLQDMSEAVGIGKRRITDILKNELDTSFYDIINKYRMEEALRLITEGVHKETPLNYLAEKAGFNSKSTFNRMFKKHTGQTPSEYIESKK